MEKILRVFFGYNATNDTLHFTSQTLITHPKSLLFFLSLFSINFLYFSFSLFQFHLCCSPLLLLGSLPFSSFQFGATITKLI
ncbi:hypothetical protein MTR67_003899 [Solanum verrucosum]|uniref:Uncharacterized protein n=1 Tax=Solanum verrucosum TaxID=315347 RepID=A0AAF0PSX1_SOLVR|nr:hypothetical protein MTR67_003899 [Solanum verrucosum]